MTSSSYYIHYLYFLSLYTSLFRCFSSNHVSHFSQLIFCLCQNFIHYFIQNRSPSLKIGLFFLIHGGTSPTKPMVWLGRYPSFPVTFHIFPTWQMRQGSPIIYLLEAEYSCHVQYMYSPISCLPAICHSSLSIPYFNHPLSDYSATL